jgi:hypothetical protein
MKNLIKKPLKGGIPAIEKKRPIKKKAIGTFSDQTPSNSSINLRFCFVLNEKLSIAIQELIAIIIYRTR